MASTLFAQNDSVPVNKGLNSPITNHPDSNSIYNEQQGYPDTLNKTTDKDNSLIKQPIKNKQGTNTKPRKSNPKQLPYKNKKANTDTTGYGTKQDF